MLGALAIHPYTLTMISICSSSRRRTSSGISLLVVSVLIQALHAADPITTAFGFAQIGLPQSPVEGTTVRVAEVDDFNKDGHDDILCFSAGNFSIDTHVWIAFAQPDGGYVVGDVVDLGERIDDDWAVSAADIDGDSVPEIIVRDAFFSEYKIYREDGSVEIVSVTDLGYFHIEDDDSYGPVIRHADLDGDGVDELIFNSNRRDMIVRWSSLAPDQSHATYTNGIFDDDNMIYPPADYNADGHTDVLVHALSVQSLVLYEGKSTIGFNAVTLIDNVPQTIDPFEIPIPCQLDADPHYDFVQRGPGVNDITTYYNPTGPSSILVTRTYAEPLLPVAVIPDLDGEGAKELAVSRSTPYLNTSGSDAVLAMIKDFESDESELIQRELGFPFVNPSTYATEYWPIPRVFSTDLDRDGSLDLVLNSGEVEPVSYLNPGTESGAALLGAQQFSLSSTPLHALAINLDQDDELEVVISTRGSVETIDAQSGVIVELPNIGQGFMSALADLEGDNEPELIIVSSSYSQFFIMRIVGDGTLELIRSYVYEGVSNLQSIVVADFNEDGRDDFAVTLSDEGIVQVLGGEPGATLSLLSNISLTSNNIIKPAALDFNRDGHLDLAIGYRFKNEIGMYAGDGNGQFAFSHTIESASPYWLTAADMDHDGNEDLIVSSFDYAPLHIDYLNENGQRINTIDFIGSNGTEAVATDVDQDGDLDLVVSDSFNHEESYVYFQTESGEFSNTRLLINAERSTGLNLGDFNNDQVQDLVIVSDADDAVRIHYGIPQSTPCPADLNNDGELNFFDISAFLTDQPDYNGDGVFNFFDVPAFITDFNAGCP